ncbi:aminopeptidase C [Segatella salivae]|jgi:putative cysteine peptidase|uniref:Aminopeptidase n=2 Tax=Segatella salivae TaxID=228604 RepID=U2ML38_9BACT|nr:C1 family peptidase [Segatella salivae]EFV03129.1 peptidase C1-like family [Segatella salivae DSM 15606]ERJ99958.1 peptidase C1-like protein [Segatella salivae F0493]MBF1521145.1 aminopeptidase [Segatella salivae]MBF1522778.1 aminopeptidase [Segatella salivae]MBF1526874.1 aminopeptidase [Segatella salivae]
MRKLLVMALLAVVALNVNAEEKKAEKSNANKPVFTVIKENKITSIKNQSRSGTCWDYSTLSFLEAEILKKTGKTYDLCEAFVANKTYFDRAVQVVRMHGDCQFAQGGSAYDPIYCLKHYGICPEDAMPLPGTLYGDSLNNFNEFFDVMTPYVLSVAKSKTDKLSSQWKVALHGIIDAYLGKCPEKFTYQGKSYTPMSFAQSLEINPDDYESFTSYTHHPFWTAFAVEVQDNWRNPLSWNLPLDDMMRIIDNAVMNGYTVAWGGDVSEPGFTRDGLAYSIDAKKAQSLSGSDMAHWLKLTKTEKKNVLDSLGCKVPEVTPTQKLRQERFDNWELTDDHGMLIYGIAKDQNGKEYYMVKNSWGETGDYKGIWYMTKNYIANNTMDFIVNKNAVPKDIRKKLGI